MNRFFVDPAFIGETSIEIPQDTSSQIRNVLRLKDGTPVQFLDNQGWLYDCNLRYLNEKSVIADITGKQTAEGEPSCQISLYVSLTQREKFEWILQKCTEAGVSEIIPIITERTLVRKAADISDKKGRWEKILKEASEQCGRGRIPILHPAVSFFDAVQNGAKADKALFFHFGENTTSIHQALCTTRNFINKISLMVGPEGGFSDDEARNAKSNGWIMTTLGKRVYRMETAAMSAVILVLYEIETIV